jgi:acetate CoA-transferase
MLSRPERRGTRVPLLNADQAVAYIPSSAMLAIAGAGGGVVEPTALIQALACRFETTQQPRDLGFYHSTGMGDRGERGMSVLAKPGLVRRAVGGHWGQSPRLADMAQNNEIEAYNLPQGVMCQLVRAAAAKQPGILTHVGLGTFVDPRQSGGKLNERTQEDLVQLMTIDGKEYLFYKTVPIDVAFIRGTTADTDGYISMEDEICYLDTLALAQAAHNNGGLVICQVEKLVKARTLHPRSVRIPGFLVDVVVVVPEQTQLYTGTSRFFSGDFTMEEGEVKLLPLTERKLVARRALMEIGPGNVGNVGVGIADGIGVIAREEGINEDFTLTVETGPVGGVGAQGIFFGATANMQALMDMPSQFDFYDGGGLNTSFLSFAEFDQQGNVNVHRFNGKIMGTGGFVNISQNSKKVVFCGTLTAGGLKVSFADGKLLIDSEGKFRKLLARVPEVTFNGADAVRRGQEVIFVTERAVFRMTPEGIELTEVAPGIDVERDILAHMDFRPKMAATIKTMDSRLFRPEIMGIKDEWRGITDAS